MFYIALIILSFASAVHALPDASTTGITDADCQNWATIRTVTNGRTINISGTTIQNEQINGQLTINASNVTVKCVKINPGIYGINCFTSGTCAGGLIENVEISGCNSSCLNAKGKSGSWLTVNKVHLHDSKNDLMKIEGYTRLQNSYLHSFTEAHHNDAIQTSVGSEIDIQYNRINGNFQEQTSAYIAKSDFGPITNIRLMGNELSGGTYTLYLNRGTVYPTPANVVVRDNTWLSNSWKNGPLDTDTGTGECFEWINNTYSDGSAFSRTSSTENTCLNQTLFPPPTPSTQAVAPTLSPVAGIFLTPAIVSMTSSDQPPYAIHYTLDTSTPTSGSALYSVPIAIDVTKTVKAITIKSGLTDSSVTTGVYEIGSFTSGATWQSATFASQSGSFNASVTATPSAPGLDGVVGLGSVQTASDYSDLAMAIRFNTSGFIDVRNGDVYDSISPYPYSTSVPYTFTISSDLSTHSYAVSVKPAGGSATVLSTGYAFRTEQASITSVDTLSMKTTGGTLSVFNFSIAGAECP